MTISGKIVKATAIVTILSMASMVFAFLLQMLLASSFGASSESDAYVAATTIPNLLNAVLLTAMSITFIPVFVEYETNATEEEAWRVAASFIVVALLSLIIFSLIGSLFSEQLIRLIAPGLARDPGTVRIAADLQRILLQAMVLVAFGGLLAGLFYAHKSFAIPTLGPLLSGVVAFLFAWLFVNRLGIYSLAIGSLVGAAVQVVFLLLLLRIRYSFRLSLDLTHPGVQRIGLLMLPWILGAMIYKANPVIDRFIGSQFDEGTISILGYAFLIVQVAVFVSSKGASLSIFPTMSRLISEQRSDRLHQVIDTGIRLVITVLAPVVVMAVLLGDELVAVALQRGQFSSESTQMTSEALIAYTGAIVALSIGNVIAYVYYALQDTRTPAIVGVLGMALNLALALGLRYVFGFLAPAISFSIMTLFNLSLLWLILHRRLGKVVTSDFPAYCIKIVASSAVMFIILLTTKSLVEKSPVSGQATLIPMLFLQLTLGLLGYATFWSLTNKNLVGELIHHLAFRGSA